MVQHVALLRGITPLNPLMRNALLVELLTSLGFGDVTAVISSGNVVFDSEDGDRRRLERRIEAALLDHLGAPCTTIVRSRRQVVGLCRLDPFAGHDDGPAARCHVTFLKQRPRGRSLPCEGDGFEVLGVHHGAAFFTVDSTRATTPGIMRLVERTFGEQVTTRTWRTVHRIRERFEAAT